MKVILELGSGAAPQHRDDAKVIHLDIVEGPDIDLLCNLNHGIPLPSNTIDAILAIDVIEHLDDVLFIMNEMHRVLKPDGLATIQVPQAGTYNHYTDITHRRGFTKDSFDYFDDTTFLGGHNGKLYTPRRWKIVSKQESGGNHIFILKALKPGEEAKECGLWS
jgi:SAM-dependent methyltransferase